MILNYQLLLKSNFFFKVNNEHSIFFFSFLKKKPGKIPLENTWIKNGKVIRVMDRLDSHGGEKLRKNNDMVFSEKWPLYSQNIN